MPVVILQVRGMGCRRCVREVSARLRDVVGVQLVSADVEGETVSIVGDMAPEAVLAAFSGTAYRPRVVHVATED
jgi:copper chaperone CopZ